jgi:two-component system phosphate regulon sensor histidine kinase PhoR
MMYRRLLGSFALVCLGTLAGAIAVVYLCLDALSRGPVLLGLTVVALLGIACSFLLAYILSSRVVRPVIDLITAVDNMGKGMAKPRVYPTDQDEVSLLGETFNRMSERLGKRIAELEEDRQQLHTILSGMVEGVVALDAEQRVLFVNARARELLELSQGPLVGLHLWEVVRHRQLLDAVAHALVTAEPHREEITWEGHLSRSLTIHAARLAGDAPRGAVVVLHDTTELRRLERLRQDFVANVSHELKTPLSVIKVCVETLQDGAVDDRQHRDRFLDQIARQGDRLHALILDLLALARIESGDEMYTFRDVALVALAHEAVERHQPRAEARSQTLILEVVDEPVVWADEEAIDTILENLLDNALKYTPEGGQVRVRIGIQEGMGQLAVIDTGFGIPEADLPRIFERFYRVDKARSREMGGTGLGLSIVKHLAQALHGTVRATSTVGVGTTLTLTIPLADP